ncbi:hypothetical protein L1049_015711 [Liquidambar formosana]|uniref:Cytochrome b561 domain-containing protein n=1 Tax=Liquidambar formosana TaxID=63359 RepID=A0AAP0RYC1_LIQFO
MAMLLLFWVSRSEFNLANKPGRDTNYKHLHVPIGGVIMLLGLMFLIIGFAIVADLALNLSGRLQQQKETGSHQELIKMGNEAAREIKATHEVIARISAAVICLLMLLWAIYTGFRLATVPRRDSNYSQLAFSIGIVTIAFGSVYFVIGIAIVKELAQDLSGRLQRKKKRNWHSMSCFAAPPVTEASQKKMAAFASSSFATPSPTPAFSSPSSTPASGPPLAPSSAAGFGSSSFFSTTSLSTTAAISEFWCLRLSDSVRHTSV